MNIDTTKNLKFTVTRDSGLVTFDITDSLDAPIGTIRISEKRAHAFFMAMQELNRVSYSVFEDQETYLSLIANQETGTIEFEGV